MCIGRALALAEFKVSGVYQGLHCTSNLRTDLDRGLDSHSQLLLPPAPDQPDIDFYHLGSNTVKPKVRGKESEGVKLPLCIRRV